MTSPLSTLRQAGLVVRRKDRLDEQAWQDAGSWLGGLPNIALEDWPRHPNTDEPLTHLAQINFAEISQGPWSDYLPKTGALCFFIQTYGEDFGYTIQTVYVSDPEHRSPCDPPADCPPIGGPTDWTHADWNRACTSIEDARRVMPRWPVDFVPVKCSERGDDEDKPGVNYDPPLDTILGPRPDYVKTPPPTGRHHAPVCLQGEAPWEAARQIVVAIQNNAQFDRARDLPSGIAAKLKDMAEGARRRRDILQEFHDRWEGPLAQNDPYEMMGAEQAKAFGDDVYGLSKNKAISNDFSHAYLDLSQTGGAVYRSMMLGSRELYEKIPEQIRERIYNEWGASAWGTDGTHQVFGIGLDLQGYLDENASYLLLFQATSDYMMDWEWGDLGIFQFFITPEDLAARNWSGIKCDFYMG